MGMIFTSKDGTEVKSNVSEVGLLLSFVSKRTLFESTFASIVTCPVSQDLGSWKLIELFMSARDGDGDITFGP